MSELTALQQMVGDEETAEEMAEGLRAAVEDENDDELRGFEITLTAAPEDVPLVIEELEEMTEDG